MGRRLQDAHLRIQELSTDEVEQRVARAMLRLFEQSGQPVADGIGIGFPITRQDIAELTGTTLHTVSRLLNDWKQRGIVDCGRKRVVLRSPARWRGCRRRRRPGWRLRGLPVLYRWTAGGRCAEGRGARAAGLIRRCFRVAGPGGGGE